MIKKCLLINLFLFQSYLTRLPSGQLGNHLTSYAVLSSLQTHFSSSSSSSSSVHFIISQETTRYLHSYFESSKLLLPSIDQLCLCNYHHGVRSKPWDIEFWSSDTRTDHVKVRFISPESSTTVQSSGIGATASSI